MRILKTLLILFITIQLSSCKDKIIINDSNKTFTNFPIEKQLELKKLVKTKFGNVRQIITIDSTLILKNHGGPGYNLYNYSLKTHTFSKPYIPRGKDLKQVLGLTNIGVYKNSLYLNDFTAKKMMLLNKNNAIKDSSNLDIKEFSFKGNRFYRSILINNLKCVCTGSEKSKYKIQIIDLPTGKIIDEFGRLRNRPKNTPLHIITKASLTQTFTSPNSEKVVLAYIHTDVIEIFDINTKKSISLKGPENFNTEFKNYQNRWFETEKTRVAYIGGSVTDKHIYLLYSGKYFSDKNAYRSKYIFVYDWNLKPIKKIKLNMDVSQISISNDDKTLYSFDKNSKNIIYAKLN